MSGYDWEADYDDDRRREEASERADEREWREQRDRDLRDRDLGESGRPPQYRTRMEPS